MSSDKMIRVKTCSSCGEEFKTLADTHYSLCPECYFKNTERAEKYPEEHFRHSNSRDETRYGRRLVEGFAYYD